MWAAVMQAASTFSFNINKEIGGNSAVLYRRSYIQHLTTSHVKLQTQIWDLAWKQNIQRKKSGKNDHSSPVGQEVVKRLAARYRNETGLDLN